jgi:hypothetical protein
METIHHTALQKNEIDLNWLNNLERNNVQIISLDPYHDQRLINTLNSAPEWIIEFEDDDAIFYSRED